GILDLEKEASIEGTYTGVKPMGLLWSMDGKADREVNIIRLIHRDVTTPQYINLKVHTGPINGVTHNDAIAETTIQRLFMGPGVRRFDVRENGLVATLFLPPGNGPFPGVITLFGGYPGIAEFKAALLATNGFAALGLAYYGTEHLTPNFAQTLDMEYFENAVKFLTSHESVCGGIGVVAICKGAQIALTMAACLKNIRCVVAINGAMLNFMGDVKYKDKFWPAEKFKPEPKQCLELRDYFKIPFDENITNFPSFVPFHTRKDISYLFICGMDDRCIPNERCFPEFRKLMESAEHPDYEITRYENVGHLLEPPYAVHTYRSYQPGFPFNVFLGWGGDKVEHCKAQEDSWTKQLDFLRSRL
uniref:BAAT/Acyl-CoA thioester hydrolase C-terminal domain-containing protein n=1 Tax=Ciona savignyi TaxID=51511 RepID=H2Y513_CIOSA